MSTTIKTLLISTLVYLMGSSVILSSVHAKDLASHHTDAHKALTTSSKVSTDLSAKAVGELHNHIDKTVFKAFAKSSSDQATVATRREEKQDGARAQNGIGTLMIEFSLITRILFARAFSL